MGRAQPAPQASSSKGSYNNCNELKPRTNCNPDVRSAFLLRSLEGLRVGKGRAACLLRCSAALGAGAQPA